MAAAPPALKPPAIRSAVTGAAIAADAVRYAGRGYVYGGNASTPGDWDCSSFISYVLGHDLGMALPGGRFGDPGFPPTAHGPVVTDYASWTSASAISEAQAGPGDLVCWVGVGTGGHIGIVLGPDKMVSALNSRLGTLVSPITGYGPLGVPQVYRRIGPAAPGSSTGAGPAGGGGGGGTLLALALGTIVIGGLLGAVIGLAALAGYGASAAAAYLAARAVS